MPSITMENDIPIKLAPQSPLIICSMSKYIKKKEKHTNKTWGNQTKNSCSHFNFCFLDLIRL